MSAFKKKFRSIYANLIKMIYKIYKKAELPHQMYQMLDKK